MIEPNLKTNVILAIAQQIEDWPEEYDQTTWGDLDGPSPWCGSCIGGLAIHLSGSIPGDTQSPPSVVAGEALGISEPTACLLFSSGWYPTKASGDVPKALRAFAETLDSLELT